MVLKPSEVAPLDAFILAEVIHDAGLPAGVFNLVTGTGPVVGEAIALHHKGRTDMRRLHGRQGTYPANEGIWIERIKQQIAADLE